MNDTPSWIPIALSCIALVGVMATAIFTYLGQRQNRQSNTDTNATMMARTEIEQALENQRARLDQIHEEYRKEIDSILASHEREIVALRTQYESQITELQEQMSQLRLRAERAERRADRAEERAAESAEHATRCDAALTQLQSEHLALTARVEEMHPDEQMD